MTPNNAIAFVRAHGIVLESARGSVPILAEAVAGERIQGGWWGHPKGHDIFVATRAVRDSPDVLVCRLLGGKVTYIHRRLWPAVVRLAARFRKDSLAAIQEEHTASGSHRIVRTPFPDWVDTETQEAADRYTEEEALSELGELLRKSLNLPKVIDGVGVDADGVFLDGWLSQKSFVVVNPTQAGKAVLRGMVPGSIGLNDQEIQIANEAGDTVRKKLETGPFEIEVPVKAGRSKISIDFSQAANLPKGDGRNVAALLQSIAVTSAPE